MVTPAHVRQESGNNGELYNKDEWESRIRGLINTSLRTNGWTTVNLGPYPPQKGVESIIQILRAAHWHVEIKRNEFNWMILGVRDPREENTPFPI